MSLVLGALKIFCLYLVYISIVLLHSLNDSRVVLFDAFLVLEVRSSDQVDKT